MVRSGVFLFSCFSEGLSSSFLLRFPPLFRGREFSTTWYIVQFFKILRYLVLTSE